MAVSVPDEHFGLPSALHLGRFRAQGGRPAAAAPGSWSRSTVQIPCPASASAVVELVRRRHHGVGHLRRGYRLAARHFPARGFDQRRFALRRRSCPRLLQLRHAVGANQFHGSNLDPRPAGVLHPANKAPPTPIGATPFVRHNTLQTCLSGWEKVGWGSLIFCLPVDGDDLAHVVGGRHAVLRLAARVVVPAGDVAIAVLGREPVRGVLAVVPKPGGSSPPCPAGRRPAAWAPDQPVALEDQRLHAPSGLTTCSSSPVGIPRMQPCRLVRGGGARIQSKSAGPCAWRSHTPSKPSRHPGPRETPPRQSGPIVTLVPGAGVMQERVMANRLLASPRVAGEGSWQPGPSTGGGTNNCHSPRRWHQKVSSTMFRSGSPSGIVLTGRRVAN